MVVSPPSDLLQLGDLVDEAGAAEVAAGCQVAQDAHRLVGWAARLGLSVTPGGALRPPDVPAAAAVLGLPPAQQVRRAADVPRVHRAWLTAIASGALTVTGGVAVAGNEGSADSGSEAGLPGRLDGWLAGLRAACRDLSGRQRPESVLCLVLATLEELIAACPAVSADVSELPDHVSRRLLSERYFSDRVDDRAAFGWVFGWLTPPSRRDRVWRLFPVLEQFGVVEGEPASPRVTAAGRWVAARLRAEIPREVDEDWPVADLLVWLMGEPDEARRGHALRVWGRDRDAVDAARVLLEAGAAGDVAARVAAVDAAEEFGEPALPVWPEFTGHPTLGPHARAVLQLWDRGPDLEPVDQQWLRVERAAALVAADPQETLNKLHMTNAAADPSKLIAEVGGVDHPDAAHLAAALTAFVGSGSALAMEQLFELKITLCAQQSECWRRILVPATAKLGELSWVIAVLFGWDGEHLHVFRVGQDHYSDPFGPLEETYDEFAVRLCQIFTGKTRKIEYTYDLGAGWRHEITLEKKVRRSPGQVTVQCVDFTGGSPIQYRDPEGRGSRTRPFQLDEVNATFVSGHYVVPDDDDDEFDTDDESDTDDSDDTKALPGSR